MNFSKSLTFLVIMLVSFTLTGCATTMMSSSINTPNGPIQAQGDVTVVERTTTTPTETTFQSAMSADMARHQERLAKIQARVEIARAEAQADVEKARARAENPCSSWFMAPSYCYGYSGDGVQFSGSGPGGSNRTYRTGSGQSNLRLPRGPGGTNGNFFSGGNSGNTGGTSGGGTGGTK